MPGFPIRTSSDPRSVDSSPRHIAASHVLHRLPVPRHPPCALTHLQHKKPEKNKKLHHNKPHNPRQTPTGPTQDATPHKGDHTCGLMLATTIHKSNTTPHHQDGATTDTPHPGGRHPPPPRERARGPVASGPNSVSGGTTPHRGAVSSFVVVHPTPAHYRREPSNESPRTPNPHTVVGGPGSRGAP